MERVRVFAEEYRSLGLLLLLVGAVSTTAIMSCGEGGGSADGGLCSECGLSPDGPCQEEVFVAPGPDAPEPCKADVPNPQATCGPIELICRRKVDSAQQRCFPVLPDGDIDFQFKCDGSRPGGTAVPQPTQTPTPTGTPTSTAPTATPTGATATSTPAATATALNGAFCGNGEIEDDEDCDGNDLDGDTCDDHCSDEAGTLGCNADCTFDFSGCVDPQGCS